VLVWSYWPTWTSKFFPLQHLLDFSIAALIACQMLKTNPGKIILYFVKKAPIFCQIQAKQFKNILTDEDCLI
jgi:hypothetical protein